MSGRTDMERLDWMEKSGAVISRHAPNYVVIWTRYSTRKTGDYVAKTFRSAIDAAMDAEERG